MSPPPPWKDGTWKGWGSCRHGDLEATVIIESGKIKNARITDCRTRYSCNIIDELPPEVVERQTADVDRVGGATESADAYYYAVYEALRQANEAAKGHPITAPTAPQSN
jgi:fumarate reductase flavoprotein subunit